MGSQSPLRAATPSPVPEWPRGLQVGYICKAVDESHPALANQVRWIRALADQPRVRHVYVLTPRRGSATLPANVTVRTFGGRSRLRLRHLGSGFARELLRSSSVDLFFIAQGGPYPALLLPWRILTGRPVFHWKAMPLVTARMRFYARWCDDLIFTATRESLPLDSDKVRVIGHGIDTSLFDIREERPSRDLVAVTRVAPIKRLDEVVRAVAECKRAFGSSYTLDIVGPCDSKSRDYRLRLLQLIGELGLEGSVRLLGTVEHRDLPVLLAKYRAAINFSDTAFDKASGEVMASGLPLITTNGPAAEVIPPSLATQLVAPREDAQAQAAVIDEVLRWDDTRRLDVGSRLRDVIVKNHNLDSLFSKVLEAFGDSWRADPTLRGEPAR